MKKINLIIEIAVFSLSMLFMASCKNVKNNENQTEQATTNDSINHFEIIAYATANTGEISTETTRQLDEIIYSFLHLKDDSLEVNEKSNDYLTYLSSLKKVNPDLKVLVSLGGWGGCKTCSDVFSNQEGRKHFTESLKSVLNKYNADGIDLDWEYPAIEGFPDHAFKPEDRHNFTLLVQELREALGPDRVISFAAGGFPEYLKNSIEWKEVMAVVDHVNIMSYDIVNGNSTKTGHHTSLFSTTSQKTSVKSSVDYLDSLGVPKEKMVIGAAFYGRVWENVKDTLNGLYQQGKFKQGVAYRNLDNYLKENPGYQIYWDSIAHAPYAYNSEKGLFTTFDDSLSIADKTRYAIKNDLGGIMFWELSNDKPEKGLLNVIYQTKVNTEN